MCAETLAGCIREWRDPARAVHSLAAMLRLVRAHHRNRTRGNRLTPEALRFRLLLAFASGGARSYVKPASDQQPAEALWTRYSRAS